MNSNKKQKARSRFVSGLVDFFMGDTGSAKEKIADASRELTDDESVGAFAGEMVGAMGGEETVCEHEHRLVTLDVETGLATARCKTCDAVLEVDKAEGAKSNVIDMEPTSGT